jgi:Ca-activated chloride channel homolog
MRAALLPVLASVWALGCASSDSGGKSYNGSDQFGTTGAAGSSSNVGISTGPNGTGTGTGGGLGSTVVPGAPGQSGGGYPGQGASDAGANQGDKYVGVGTNPFVLTAHDPLSTFAADVDTASYDIFRRDANLGGVPVATSVRLEEYVNNFAYDYPAPAADDAQPFRVALGAAPHLLSRGSTLLRVGIQARKPSPFTKKPTNLVFLVDTSGSMMTADKLPLVQYTLRQTLDILDPTDEVSLVSYAGSVALRLPPTTAANRSTIEAAINGLVSNGSTNGAGGIQLAYEQAQKGFIQGGINHVIMCTDGDFNVGVSDTTSLVNLITEKRKTGITLTMLGYGIGNLNDQMMEAVSDKGDGVYAVISSQDQATTYVHQRMLSTLEHVAKDMKIQVEFNPDLVYAYRLLGYEDRNIADKDFRNDVIDAGDVGAGHRVTALYEVVATGGAIPAAAGDFQPQDGSPYTGAREVKAEDFVLVKVRYKARDAVETDPALEVAASMKPQDVLPEFAAADLDLQWAISVAAFSEILKKSPYADLRHLDIIGNIANAQAGRDGDRSEFAQLFTKVRPLIK